MAKTLGTVLHGRAYFSFFVGSGSILDGEWPIAYRQSPELCFSSGSEPSVRLSSPSKPAAENWCLLVFFSLSVINQKHENHTGSLP